MFKPPVLRRNFSLFNRIPHSRIAQAAARDGHETVIIQRVRIRRPFLSKSRLVGAVAIGIATYGLGRYVGIEVEVEVEELEEKDKKKSPRPDSQPDENGWQKAGEEVEGEEEEEDEEYDDAILFLPTGLSRPRPKTYYRGSDPEWQAFRKIATDRPRVEQIRGELASLLRNMAAQSPPYKARLGKIDTTKGKIWIEFKFPDGPPIEYERPGIELTEDLEWRKATRPVEEIHHQRLNRILSPTAVASALYQDTTTKAGKSWRDFKIYMGWEEESRTETVQQIIRRIGANPRSDSSAATPSSTPNPLATSSAKDTERPASPSAAPVDGLAEKGFVLPDPKKMTLDLSQFRADFRKASKPIPPQPPRGTFLVMGLVEIYGDRARMTLNVTAAYDPKLGRYVSIQGALWNHVEHRQAPKGGP